MRFRILRSGPVVGFVAWLMSGLAWEPSSTTPSLVDTDGDGLSDIDETAIYGTSPVLRDTDGDGMSDYDEIVRHTFDRANLPLRFNPRVADVPSIKLRITGVP